MKKIFIILLVIATMGLVACKTNKTDVSDVSTTIDVTDPEWELPIDMAVDGTTDGEAVTPDTTVPDTTQPENTQTTTEPTEPPVETPTEKPTENKTTSGAIELPFISGQEMRHTGFSLVPFTLNIHKELYYDL